MQRLPAHLKFHSRRSTHSGNAMILNNAINFDGQRFWHVWFAIVLCVVSICFLEADRLRFSELKFKQCNNCFKEHTTKIYCIQHHDILTEH